MENAKVRPNGVLHKIYLKNKHNDLESVLRTMFNYNIGVSKKSEEEMDEQEIDGILLKVILKDGGFEVNEFNLETKMREYLKTLKSTLKLKSKSFKKNKTVVITLGSNLTYKALLAGINLTENGFDKYIGKIEASVDMEPEMFKKTLENVEFILEHNLNTVKNLNLDISQ